MKKRRILGTVAMTVVAAAIVVGLAVPSSSDASSGSGNAVEVLRLRLEYQQTNLDHGTPGLTPGDGAVYSGTLYDQAGKAVGVSVGQCQIVSITPPSPLPAQDPESMQAMCNTSNVLPKGEIDTQGYLFFPQGIGFPQPWRNPIIGGTGAYKQARGEFTGHTIDQNTDEFVFEIIH